MPLEQLYRLATLPVKIVAMLAVKINFFISFSFSDSASHLPKTQPPTQKKSGVPS